MQPNTVISFPNLDDFIDALDNDTWPAACDDDRPIPKIEGSDAQAPQPSQTSLEAEASRSRQSPQVNSGASNNGTCFDDDSSLSDSLSNPPSSKKNHEAQEIGSRAEIRHLYLTKASVENGNPIYSATVPIAGNHGSNQCKKDDNKSFAILLYHGASLQTTSIKIQSPELKGCLAEVLSGYPRVDTAAPTVEFTPPFIPFLHRWERFLQAEAATDNEKSKKQFGILRKALEIELEDPFQMLQEIQQTGYVTFPNVPVALVPGEILLTSKDGMMSAGVLQDAYIEKTYQGDYVCRVKVHVLDWNGSRFGYREQQWDLESFEGFRKVTDLPAFPLRAHPDRERIKKRLIERGRSFEDLCGRRGVSNYNGLVIDDSG
ncbi:P-loop containing nucleoside triphosphate hydrolase [Fusarium albosuccineum]|uniref:P-loop containing nucleoside triphosphate hydrolase n=1 Tax=Fusarium albosuccineum TaxID=1237068 RepID=A0A8H4LHB1_9HYPO|nr:P-loop containing nucleoside triphosphate hydrolase [Fusarium albosuccineum]